MPLPWEPQTPALPTEQNPYPNQPKEININEMLIWAVAITLIVIGFYLIMRGAQ